MSGQFNLTIFGVAVGTGMFLFLLGYFARKFIAERKVRSAEQKAKDILEDAKKQHDSRKREIELEAKDLLYKLRADFDKETKERRQELNVLERRLMQKEENIDRKVDILDKKEKELADKEKLMAGRDQNLILKEKEMQQLINDEKERLQKISGLTAEEAKRQLFLRLEDEVKRESANMIKKMEDEAKEKADKEARKIIGLAIQRCAADHTVETTVSVVNLPNDEMKGRIIGREGRNIRALEIATGVDIIIDDTPEAITLSSFDAVKREIARISL
ncbi:MAG: Rnase Y domain-containing protein, partial [Candidatus Omnitrophica bacterium]|nr:Rnase Y domain-containing protein [Candidatus Omnitrophota bacterium]